MHSSSPCASCHAPPPGATWTHVLVSHMPPAWTRERFYNLCNTTLLLHFGSVGVHCVRQLSFERTPINSYGVVFCSTHLAACVLVKNLNGMEYEGYHLGANRFVDGRVKPLDILSACGAQLKDETDVEGLKQAMLLQNKVLKELAILNEALQRRVSLLETALRSK